MQQPGWMEYGEMRKTMREADISNKSINAIIGASLNNDLIAITTMGRQRFCQIRNIKTHPVGSRKTVL